MDRDKLSHLMKKAQVFVTGLAEGVSDETVVKELEAMLLALETHKNSADHDSDPHVWTALNRFLQAVEVAGLLPTSDASNIGSASRMFGKGWISELSSLVFRRGNVLAMDGLFVITKQSGKFAQDVLATDTQIDFGQALTVGDYLLLRAENKMEYMQIGSLVDGTTYNVTRDLDGSGANDWAKESVYFVRGQAGDGWLELTAVDEQRFSLFIQGQNWDQWLEDIRLGIIDGWQSAPFTGNGFAMGDYSADRYLIYTENDGFEINGSRILAGQRNVILDEKGLSITTLRDGLKFFTEGSPIGALTSGSDVRNGVLSYFIEILAGSEPTPFQIPNASFTFDDNFWNGDNFSRNTSSTPYTPPASGRFCFPFQTGVQFLYSDHFPAVPGKTVSFSFWRRFMNGSNYALLRNTIFSFDVSYYTSTNQLIRTDTLYSNNLGKEAQNPSNPTWERVSGIGPMAPENAATATILFMLSNTSDVFWAEIDDIELIGYTKASKIRLYDDGAVLDGSISAANISQTPIANGIPQAGADKLIDDGWFCSGWQDYTVQWTASTTNPKIGNGTLSGRYCKIGKQCTVIIKLTGGTTTTWGSGNYRFSLPFASSGLSALGLARIRDISPAANYTRLILLQNNEAVLQWFVDITNGTNISAITPTSPFTLSSYDMIEMQITYEVT